MGLSTPGHTLATLHFISFHPLLDDLAPIDMRNDGTSCNNVGTRKIVPIFFPQATPAIISREK